MRVLLLHPEGSPWDGGWARERWDLVVDLGYAGRDTYAEWSRTLGTRVFSIHEYVSGMESYRWVNQLFELGRGKLLDREGLDWWDLLAMESYQDLHVIYLCHRLREEIPAPEVELAASHPHRLVRIAEQVFGQRVRYFRRGTENPLRRAARALRSARNLRPAQIAEIVFDKWDAGLKFRHRWAKRQHASLADPALLMPSAYSNVTRSALAYARQLPDRRFLLGVTRRSAVPESLPANVTMVPLAAYADSTSGSVAEIAELRQAWRAFVGAMAVQHQEFDYAAKAGLWEYFPTHLEQGVHIRNAWKHLLDSEPLSGVLCGDDLNYHTRLPLILAERTGLNAVYCSHGALDGGFLFKTPFANSFLVKGEMERDYLQRVANISAEKIVVAAPGANSGADHNPGQGDAIVFFSQPFEVLNGRTRSIYQEILPRLCSAAQRSGRKVIVKLHPFESRRARQKLLLSILRPDELANVEIVDGLPPEQVMSRTWCGVTVDSSVAVECALRKIPFFLCAWLDFTGMDYLTQYSRFGVAEVLQSPQEIENIPEMVAAYQLDPATLDRLWHQAEPMQLDEIMFGTQHVPVDRCAC